MNNGNKNTLLEQLESLLKDSDFEGVRLSLESWIGDHEVDYFIVNDNKKNPARGFVVEAAAVSGSVISTYSYIAGEQTYGTIMLKSLSSVTASISKGSYIMLRLVTDSGLAYQMQFPAEKWEDIIIFKNNLERSMKNIG